MKSRKHTLNFIDGKCTWRCEGFEYFGLVMKPYTYFIDFDSARTGSETFLESEISEVERLLEKVKNEMKK